MRAIPAQRADRARNVVAKWRKILASWQLGTRPADDPVYLAVANHREESILLRVELNAVVALLIEKGVFTQDEFDLMVELSATKSNEALERRFPGARATDTGMEVDLRRAMEWWGKFPK